MTMYKPYILTLLSSKFVTRKNCLASNIDTTY